MLRINVRMSYQMAPMTNQSVLFDELQVCRFGEIDITSEVVAATYTWLTWFRRLRVFLIQSDLFHELITMIKSIQSTALLHHLEWLIIRKRQLSLSPSVRHDPLADIVELTHWPSLRHVFIEKYDSDEVVAKICHICQNVPSLETLTIELSDNCPPIEEVKLDEVRDVGKNQGRSTSIYRRSNVIQVWFDK